MKRERWRGIEIDRYWGSRGIVSDYGITRGPLKQGLQESSWWYCKLLKPQTARMVMQHGGHSRADLETVAVLMTPVK